MTPYEEMDNLRKDFHEWLKTRVSWVKSDTRIADKRIFTITEALMTEIDFLSNDLSDRTKKLLEQTDFLWTYTRVLGDALLILAKKVERIEPIPLRIDKFQDQLDGLLSMKEQFDKYVNQRAEQMRNQIQQQKERVEKDIPGVS